MDRFLNLVLLVIVTVLTAVEGTDSGSQDQQVQPCQNYGFVGKKCVRCENPATATHCYCESTAQIVNFTCTKHGNDKCFYDLFNKLSGLALCPGKQFESPLHATLYLDRKNCFSNRDDIEIGATDEARMQSVDIPCSGFEKGCMKGYDSKNQKTCLCKSMGNKYYLNLNQSNDGRSLLEVFDARTGFARCPSLWQVPQLTTPSCVEDPCNCLSNQNHVVASEMIVLEKLELSDQDLVTYTLTFCVTALIFILSLLTTGVTMMNILLNVDNASSNYF